METNNLTELASILPVLASPKPRCNLQKLKGSSCALIGRCMLCAFHAYYTLLLRVNPCKCISRDRLGEIGEQQGFCKAFVIFCGTWHRPLVHSADALRRCARLVAPPVTAVKLLRSSLNFDVHTAHTHFHTTGFVPSTVFYTIL